MQDDHRLENVRIARQECGAAQHRRCQGTGTLSGDVYIPVRLPRVGSVVAVRIHCDLGLPQTVAELLHCLPLASNPLPQYSDPME